MLSVIVPILNEERVLETLGDNLAALSRPVQVIFVDGGSSDSSRATAHRFGEVLSSPPGRARQMNLGVSAARSEVLLFLHADCLLSPDAPVAIERALANPRCVGGCLTQVFPPNLPQPLFDWIAFGGNLRARLSRTFFGDQAIFCRTDVFHRLGGFPDLPIYEDLEFSRLLNRAGLTTVLSTPVFSSPRRWLQHGFLLTTLVDWQVHLGRTLGLPPDRLARLYRRTDAR